MYVFQHAESAFDGFIIGGERCMFSGVCVFSLFSHVKKQEEHMNAPPCTTSSTIAQVTTSKHRVV